MNIVQLQRRALTALDRAASGLGLQPSLEPDRLIARARRRTGLADFGAEDPEEGLRRFLAACEAEASLSLVGRIATRWDCGRFLDNLLRFRAAEQRAPEILEAHIPAPLFIAGLPRSGTTFLHRLLLQDPANRGPLVWETIFPHPPGRGPDHRAEKVQAQLRAFERMAPEFRALHPLEADSPQECSEITAHVFRSLRFDSNYRIPSYRAWLDRTGHQAPYRFHRRFLQHLQHQEGEGSAARRWVLKCPEHLFALAEIRAVYPDARMVFVHRDPLKVLLSVARLTEVLRAPFTRTLDRLAIGRQESARYRQAVALMMRAAQEEPFAEPILHVRHDDLVRDPLGTVAGVYRHFGIELRPDAAAAVQAYAQALPNGGYGPHAYRFEDHGLDPETERAAFAAYADFFGIGADRRERVPA